MFSSNGWTHLLGSTFPNLQSLAETLIEQEELEDSQDVHMSGQELGFVHDDQEGKETLATWFLQLHSLGLHCCNW